MQKFVARPHGRSRPARRLPWAAPLIMLATAATEYAGGRALICPCGHVALWHGAIDDENSQQILDWYSPSHLIHGLIFYALTRLVLSRCALATRMLIALGIEAAWEMLENSPIIIDRYRSATMALGYTGDSILNSMSDIGCMAVGFWLASKLPVWASVTIAIGFELLTLAIIRDNLTLNILMLIAPITAIRHWQAG